VTGASGELLGVEIQPGPVGPVEVAAASLGIVGLTPADDMSASRPGAARSPRGSSTKASVAPSGLTPLEEVIAARVVRNAPHGAPSIGATSWPSLAHR
jgi:hypothetical protein